MQEINLTRSLPITKRDLKARNAAQTPENIALAKQYGEAYFDGCRDTGYGGYSYDGRWLPVAHDIIEHFKLKPGDRVLDVGCAKGFLVKDLMLACPGLEVFGLDISEYAVRHCPPEVIGRLHLGSCDHLPFPDNGFTAALSINTIHNMDRPHAIRALRELQRVSGGRAFVQVDSYHTAEQRELFMRWVLTAQYHDYPNEWLRCFEEAGYTGDYYWTVLE
jgi:ubiquinone/menaquinone biosynthesis C-methylase UbiE